LDISDFLRRLGRACENNFTLIRRLASDPSWRIEEAAN
jgi:hypothetical protein